MIARLAYAYVRLLLVLELLLFASSLVLHLSVLLGVLIGVRGPYTEVRGNAVFRLAVLVGIAVAPFVKESLRWMDQVKTWPGWMWKGALAVGVYGLCTAPLSFTALPETGFVLGFEAVSFCILYSVLWRTYLNESKVINRVAASISLVTLCVIVQLAYNAGYLRHPPNGY
jgi:hypothetical protein